MSKGSAPRKERNDEAYKANWEATFSKLGSRREVLQKNSKNSAEQAAVRSLESPRDSRDQEVDR